MKPHKCDLDWCTSTLGGYPAVDNEHMGDLDLVPATGELDSTDELPTAGVQLWWSTDLALAPHIRLAVNDGGVDLQIHEAVVLTEYLLRAISRASSHTAFDRESVIERRAR